MAQRVELLATLKFAGQLLTSPEDMGGFLVDWRRKYFGKALAVAVPASSEAVCDILRWATHTRTPVYTQGGNTGLSGGATPDESGHALVLSTARLNRVRSVDSESNVVVAEAGVVLSQVQAAAAGVDRLFPLSLAAEGSCTVGGVLATNAGGTQALRYGTARDLCLGLEVALPSGELWSGLKSLRKDNTGYSLRDLFVGSEGTLGVICAASLKLFPRPSGHVTTFLAFPTYGAALDVLRRAESAFGPGVTAFEVLDAACLRAVQAAIANAQNPVMTDAPVYGLLEVSCFGGMDATEAVHGLLASAIEAEQVLDAAVAASLEQRKKLWQLRESVSEAVAALGPQVKHDISVPIARIPQWVAEVQKRFERLPNMRLTIFGHLGDGNLHVNVSLAEGLREDAVLRLSAAVNQMVHDLVHEFDGSISAEHGLGQLRNKEAARFRPAVGTTLMTDLKRLLDPLAILGPGRVLPGPTV